MSAFFRKHDPCSRAKDEDLSSESLLNDGAFAAQGWTTGRPKFPTKLYIFAAFAGAGLLALGFIIGFWVRKPSLSQCLEITSIYSPAFDAIELYDTDFKNEFVQDSFYRGLPTPERERAWSELGEGPGHILIPDSAMTDLGRGDGTVTQYMRAPEEEGQGYVASLEVFHQLHCLNFLRQFAKFSMGDYSNETMPRYFTRHFDRPEEQSEYWRIHVDHCVETLRLSLMCHADVTPMLMKWDTSQHPPKPASEFNSRHRCRNFDKILEWNEEHALSI